MARIVKILVAGDPGSVHTTRFVSLLQDLDYQVRVFQSEDYYIQEEHLHGTTLYVSSFAAPPQNGNLLKVSFPWELEYRPLWELFDRAYRALSAFFGISCAPRPRSEALARVIARWEPDVVFSLKMQNDGYTVCEARERMGSAFRAPWVHFNWGTDIEFFGKDPAFAPEHLPRITRVLRGCDFHVADCRRDVRQAAELGFAGTSLGACLANGGFDLDYLEGIGRAPASERKVILVKGREGGLVGKAFKVLAALHRIPHLLGGYRVKIIMPTPQVVGAASFLSLLDGIDYEIMPRLPYRELLALFGQSRIAVSASDVDGTPSFLTESMAMGALPVHSDMESVREWVRDGENGLLFPVDDIEALSAQIARALADDALVEEAGRLNWQIARTRMNRQTIREELRHMIEERILPARGRSRA